MQSEAGIAHRYVELFAEEVVRGGPAFALSLVLSAVEPTLRQAAELGAWQLISPVNALGRVVVVAGLHEVQDNVSCLVTPLAAGHAHVIAWRLCMPRACASCTMCPRQLRMCLHLHAAISNAPADVLQEADVGMQVYKEPTVLLAKRVTGEEEVPEGAVAVLTPDAPDVLSHVSVRARNMRVLFAICHDAGPLKEIEQLAGKVRPSSSISIARLAGSAALHHLPWYCVLVPCHACEASQNEAAEPAQFGCSSYNGLGWLDLRCGLQRKFVTPMYCRSHPNALTATPQPAELPHGLCTLLTDVGALQAIYLETSAAGGVTWEQVEEGRLVTGGSNGSNGSGEKAPKKTLKVKVPTWCGQWVVGQNDFKDGVVGAKSKNIAGEGASVPWQTKCCACMLCLHATWHTLRQA